ncbi:MULTISPECIES: DUF397 domain-containing protein [Streptomyces]|uniref:DUF397 domain-containing protein n=1 Tax=Streptomyces TaxID=1883 RepID=UPI0003AA2B44|nr:MULTISPECIES: DUF397 domain-containing protein [Streptomyces]MBZ6114428.1 DUF397 domain-containing protein [Streptomyces olivaceus]MBZ6128232.1 DUF397 domain-containing protein [Streptomyces olivaceus]MBZ6149137.1 DUF397 domain-containing protein [Streptomyces olivaceus]MBZ6162996.1 DUF397 domain-containing protein [Streptomyces olivaceus]MBZ6190800.1 DUF397 domain-containing protein [Streptomyces olivaceus]
MTGIAPSLIEHSGLEWLKSSYSGGEGNECVEVAAQSSCVGVRDSKSTGAILTFSADAFTTFVESLGSHR